MYLKKMHNINQQVLRYKARVQNPKHIQIEYKLTYIYIYITNVPTAFKT